jgi:cytidylate kinase
MPLPSTIAIDGPAASGKSTLGKRLAEELNYLFFDTGVMYRAVTWAALDRSVPLNDGEALTSLVQGLMLDIRPPSAADGRAVDVLVDGQDVTWEIRQPDVDRNVSVVSAYPGVRQELSARQRAIGRRGGVVMVGRDIGTVVLPEAELKIFLHASAEERARRRYEEQLQRGMEADYTAILAGIYERDRIDSTRAVAPLRQADDAIAIDSDGLSIDETYTRVAALVQAHAAAH